MSVCSPELAVLLRLEIKPRLANRLVSINSQEIRPGGAVELEISDSESKVFFGVLVLEIGGINLFLGKKFLEKFGTRMKIGAYPEYSIGDIPVGVMAEKEIETLKLVSLVGRMITARSSALVEIEVTSRIPRRVGH